MLSIIIPANNEEAWLGPCLEALLAQEGLEPGAAEVIVAANACTDTTVAIAESYRPAFEAKGWPLTVLDIAEGGKLNALNRGDAAATGTARAYLDADIVCSPPLMAEIIEALSPERPVYASGTLVVAPARSWITHHYGRLWARLPFMTEGVPGAGLFAVNAAGRARWDRFPDIIADDGYVQFLFRPEERIKVTATYTWPMVEGFRALVKVRRRQDAGGRELREKFPELAANEGKRPVRGRDHLRLFCETPVSYLVYATVTVAVKLGGRGQTGWSRGR